MCGSSSPANRTSMPGMFQSRFRTLDRRRYPKIRHGDREDARSPRFTLAIDPEPSLDKGESLLSPATAGMSDNFYSWRGASGARYVASVFEAREANARRALHVFASRDFDAPRGREPRAEPRALGCNEWRVRFNARSETFEDLAASFAP